MDKTLGDCQPVGLIDVTDCYYGFPISLSFPHFMNGDLGLQKNITGISPDPQKHSSTFVIQPVIYHQIPLERRQAVPQSIVPVYSLEDFLSTN
ncbi:scavenger receptor class B member 1-like [Drosophila santomea]|uniref:scavenger receptor class B member 1-like n=1 Tax=Drosophila santomea TaxID=129105 RepID=UPI001CCFDFD9|nr:scavenger receptor class B member 1-like [Drosophila santomea]